MNIRAIGDFIKIELNGSNLCISEFLRFKKNYSIGVHSFKIEKYKAAGKFKSGRLSFEVWKGHKRIYYDVRYSKEEQENFDELVKILKYGLPQEGLIHTAMGVNGLIELYENKMVIKRDSNSSDFYTHGLKGNKELWLKSISAIELKLPGTVTRGFLTRGMQHNGFIQFTIPGGIESTKGIISSVFDENSVLFDSNHINDFVRLKDLIEDRLFDLEHPNYKGLQLSNDTLLGKKQIVTSSYITHHNEVINDKIEKDESIEMLENVLKLKCLIKEIAIKKELSKDIYTNSTNSKEIIENESITINQNIAKVDCKDDCLNKNELIFLLEDLARLKNMGILTEEEFNEKKKEILEIL